MRDLGYDSPMTRTTLGWAEGRRALADFRIETPAFALSAPELTRERAGDRIVLRFTAQGERRLAGGGFELSNVHAVLVDRDGAPIVRRYHDSGRQCVLGKVCTWAHELYDEQLAGAAALVYEVETRVDLRRTLAAGVLEPIDLDDERRRPWPHKPTTSGADPLLHLSLALVYNRGDLDVSLVGEPTCVHDGHSTQLELDLLDQEGVAVASRTASVSIGATGLGYTDTSVRLERRVAKLVRGFEVRGRSEVRMITRLGPFIPG